MRRREKAVRSSQWVWIDTEKDGAGVIGLIANEWVIAKDSMGSMDGADLPQEATTRNRLSMGEAKQCLPAAWAKLLAKEHSRVRTTQQVDLRLRVALWWSGAQ